MHLEAHELARLVPPMSDEEYGRLRDDIRDNGLIETITLYEGKILDGRHRYQACEELNIESRTRDYDGDDPARFVISLNVNRRHLTVAQRAVIALAALPHYREAAKKRQLAGVKVTLGPVGPKVCETGKATRQAAVDVGLSRNTVQRLDRVQRGAPDLYEKVVAETMTIRTAERILKERVNGTSPQPARSRKRDVTRPFEVVTERDRMWANRAKGRMERLVASLNGYTKGLEDFDTPRALATATPEEINGWVKSLTGAIVALSNLRSTMKGVLA